MTKLSNLCKYYLDAYDLSLSGLEAMIAAEKEFKDQTALADSAESALMGAIGKTVAEFSGLHDDGSTDAYAGLKALVGSDTSRVLTLHLGTTIGDDAILTLVKVQAIRNAIKFRELLPVSGEFSGQLFPEFGQVQYPKTAITVTTAGSGLDGTAQSASGGAWAYHIIAWSATGGNARWQLNFQHDSAANFATVVTKDGPVNITAIGAARRAISGTVERYTRLQAVLDADTGGLTVACVFKRT